MINFDTITQETSGSEEIKIRMTKETKLTYSFHKIQIRDSYDPYHEDYQFNLFQKVETHDLIFQAHKYANSIKSDGDDSQKSKKQVIY